MGVTQTNVRNRWMNPEYWQVKFDLIWVIDSRTHSNIPIQAMYTADGTINNSLITYYTKRN